MNPYDELSLDKTADPATIKRAYRKRAKKVHPDAGGTTEDFNRIQRAYLVLSDPARRSRYDATGEIDETSVDNTQAQAVSCLVGFFSSALASYLNGGADPSERDMIAEARVYLRKELVTVENARNKHAKARDAMLAFEARFSVTNPPFKGLKAGAQPDLLKRALKAQAEHARAPLQQIEQQLTVFKAALLLLDYYTFEKKTAEGRQRTTSTFFYMDPAS